MSAKEKVEGLSATGPRWLYIVQMAEMEECDFTILLEPTWAPGFGVFPAAFDLALTQSWLVLIPFLSLRMELFMPMHIQSMQFAIF